MFFQFAIVLSGVVSSSAFIVSQMIRGSPVLGATASDAISTLEVSHATSINSIASQIPDLQPKPNFT